VTHSALVRWLSLVAITSIGLALFLYLAQDKLIPSSADPLTGGTNYGAAGTAALISMAQWGFAALGVLLFLSRVLIGTRWRYSWIAFLIVGVCLLITAFSSFNSGAPFAATNSDEMATVATVTEMTGFACFPAALLLFTVERLRRRRKYQIDPHAAEGIEKAKRR
jgi:hypothetical protein